MVRWLVLDRIFSSFFLLSTWFVPLSLGEFGLKSSLVFQDSFEGLQLEVNGVEHYVLDLVVSSLACRISNGEYLKGAGVLL